MLKEMIVPADKLALFIEYWLNSDTTNSQSVMTRQKS